jgi:xanthine dehydrogenase accessory factor
MNPSELYREMAALTDKGTPFVVVTVVESSGSTPRKAGAKMIVLPDGRTVDTIGGGKIEAQGTLDALEALKRGISGTKEYALRQSGDHALGMVCGGDTKLFFEVHIPARTLLLVGAGHVSQKLAPLGKMLDMRVVVVDNREELANADVLPWADEIVIGDQGNVGDLVPINERTAVVIVTHGHLFDKDALRSVLGRGAGYVGMIGSRAKVRTVLSDLEDEGADPAELAQVHAPIGLDIGGQTPAEISVSILAEIIAVEHGKDRTGRNVATASGGRAATGASAGGAETVRAEGVGCGA